MGIISDDVVELRGHHAVQHFGYGCEMKYANMRDEGGLVKGVVSFFG